MADRKTVISHLQIIHTWAEFALKRDLQFFTEKHLEEIAQWSDDALELLKEQETANLYKCPNCGTWVFAENVIRCKDCEYFRDTKNVYNGEPFGTCTNCRTSMTGYALHSFEWFCADGKRKEGR